MDEGPRMDGGQEERSGGDSSTNRRWFLASVGTGIGVALAGCSGTDEAAPEGGQPDATATSALDGQQTPEPTRTPTEEPVDTEPTEDVEDTAEDAADETEETAEESAQEVEKRLSTAGTHLYTALAGMNTRTGSLSMVADKFGATPSQVLGALEAAGDSLDAARQAQGSAPDGAIEQLETTRDFLSVALDVVERVSSMTDSFDGTPETAMAGDYEDALTTLRSVRSDVPAARRDIKELRGILDTLSAGTDTKYGPSTETLRPIVTDSAAVNTALEHGANGFIDICKGGAHMDKAGELYDEAHYQEASVEYGAARWDFGNALSAFSTGVNGDAFTENFETYSCVAEAHRDAADLYQMASVDTLVGRVTKSTSRRDSASDALERDCVTELTPDDAA